VARTAGVGVRISPDTYRVIDPDALAKYVRDGGGPIVADMTRRAGNVQAGARQQVGKRTRRLERSIVKRPGVDNRGPFVDVVTEGVRYALFHHAINPYLTDNLHRAGR
jgi:hypothetical protein